MNLPRNDWTICLVALLALIGSSTRAASVLDFEVDAIGSEFGGDTVGSTAGPFLIDGILTTFTTQGLPPSGALSASSFGLGISAGGTDPDPGSFNIFESWAVSADTGLGFLGVDFGGVQAEETVSIRCDAWIGLTDIAPASPSVTFIALTGTFLFTDVAPADTDIFDISAMTGGASLPVPAGSNLVFSFVNSTFGPNDDVELSTITLAGMPSVFDFGDAPDPDYPTLLASNGARHKILSGYHLGASIDGEADGQASAQSNGDGADEDGVAFTSPLRLNVLPIQTTLEVTASALGRLDGWVDFNKDGDWFELDEQIFNSEPLAAGVNDLAFSVPPDAALGCLTFARFRFSNSGGLTPAGEAPDGEVEDYAVSIIPDDDLDLFNRSIAEDAVFVAANSIAAGGDFTTFPDLSVLAPANVVFHAGNHVVLRNGVFVEDGARLTVTTGPVLSCP